MSNEKRTAGLPPCQTVLFRDRPVIGPNSVVFLDNRPGQEHLYHHRFVRMYKERQQAGTAELLRRLREADPNANAPLDPPELEELVGPTAAAPADPDADALSTLLEDGVGRGLFRDTTKVAEWIGAVNHFAGWENAGVEPMELVVTHAENHIETLIRRIIAQRIRPAGIILSGSPKMLTQVRGTRVIRQTLLLVDHALRRQIPILGICFGFHLLMYARYRAMVRWLRVPEDAGAEFHPALGEFSEWTNLPDNRRMVYGSRRVHRIRHHPVLNQVDRVLGLMVHSQHLWPDHSRIPQDAVLAVSHRYFRENRWMRAEDQIRQTVLQVVEAGPVAIGTQLHPELTPELLLALTYVPAYADALTREGYRLDLVRCELKRYPKGHFAGKRIGYNWVKRIMAPAFIERLCKNGRIPAEQAEMLRFRLAHRGLSLASQIGDPDG